MYARTLRAGWGWAGAWAGSLQLKRATEAKEAQVAAAHTLATEVVGRHNVWVGCGDMLIR